MAFSTEDLYNIYLKDTKYNIGMGVGNAFNKAVDFYLSNKNINVGKSESDALMIIEGLRNMFFESNRIKVEKEFESFVIDNPPSKWLEEKHEISGLVLSAQENLIPAIQDYGYGEPPKQKKKLVDIPVINDEK